MIVVDRSVWIAQFSRTDVATIERLLAIKDTKEILAGCLILLEMLQGARSDPEAVLIEKGLRQFTVQPMLSDNLLGEAAGNYRLLRKGGQRPRLRPNRQISACRLLDAISQEHCRV